MSSEVAVCLSARGERNEESEQSIVIIYQYFTGRLYHRCRYNFLIPYIDGAPNKMCKGGSMWRASLYSLNLYAFFDLS